MSTAFSSDCFVEPGLESYVQRVQDGVRSSLIDVLGLQLTHLSRSLVAARLLVMPHHLQPFGLMHGGMNALIAEEIGSVAASLAVGFDATAIGTCTVAAHHLSSAFAGDVAIATATRVSSSPSGSLWTISITVVDAKSQKQRDTSLCTYHSTVHKSATATAATTAAAPLITVNANHNNYTTLLAATTAAYRAYTPDMHIEASAAATASARRITHGLASPLGSLLGLSYSHISSTALKQQVVIDARHLNSRGCMHGGVSSVMAEELGSVLANLHSSAAAVAAACVGTWIEVIHTGSAYVGDTVTGTATAIKIGKRTQAWRIDVCAVTPVGGVGAAAAAAAAGVVAGESRLIAYSQLSTFATGATQKAPAKSKL